MEDNLYLYDKAVKEILHYIDIDNKEKAQIKIQEALSQYAEDGYLHYLMASCLYCSDKYQEAIEECITAMELGYSLQYCKFLLAKISMELEQYQKSEELFLDALSIEPNDADVLASYGLLMLKTGFNEKAMKLINEAIKIEPENYLALRNKYYLQLASNKQSAYIDTLESLMYSSSNEQKKLINIAMKQLMEKKYRAARETIRQIYIMNPTNHELLSWLKLVERQASIFLAPMNFVSKIGGSMVLWIGVMLSALILNLLGQDSILTIILCAYIVFCIYSWIVYFVYKIKEKREINGQA